MLTNNSNFWLRQTPEIKSIATLEPTGSSSQYAAQYLSELLDEKLNIHLFSSFEEASEYVEQHASALLLVANAYKAVDNFYMNANTALLGSFFYSPPPYFLGTSDVSKLLRKIKSKHPLKVVSHHAPLSRVDGLIKSSETKLEGISDCSIDIELTASTSYGAQLVAQKQADICLANIEALNLYGLSPISTALDIDMTWVIFSNCTDDKKEHVS